MRFRSKQKPVYFAIDKALIQRHHILKLSLAFLNVFALMTVVTASLIASGDKPAYAASYTWDGGGATNNWSDCANWSTNVCPVAADTVTFNATSVKDSTVDAGFGGTVAGVTIATGYTGTLSLGRSLTSTGVFTQAAGSNFSAGSNDLFVATTFTVSSGPNFNAGTGRVIFNGASSGIATCNDTVFNSVVFAHTNGTKTVQSGCIFPIGNNPIFASSVTINGGQLVGMGAISSTGVLTLNSSVAAGLSGFTGLTIGTLTVSNGAIGDFSGYTLLDINASFSVVNTSTFIAPTGEMTVAGATNIANTATYNANGGTVRFDGGTAAITCQPTSFSNAALSHASGTKTINTGCTLPLGANPILGASSVTVNGTLSGSGVINSPAGTLTLANNGVLSGFSGLSATALVVSGVYDLSTYSSLTTSSSLTLNSPGNLTLPAGANVSVGTSLIINNGATFTSTSGILTVNGTFTNGATATFNHNNGIVALAGTNTIITCNNAVFNLVQLLGIGTKTINLGCNLPLGNNPTSTNGVITLNGTLSGTGTLTHTGTTLTVSNAAPLSGFTGLVANTVTVSTGVLNLSLFTTADINGTLTLANGTTLTAPSGDLFVGANLTINSGATFNHNNGTVISEGTNTVFTCNNAVFNLVKIHGIGTASVNSGCVLPLGNNPIVFPALILNGRLTGTGTLTVSGSLLTINSGAALTNFTGLNANGVTLGTNAGLNLASYTTADINSTLTINGGSTFTAPSNQLFIGGGLSISSSATFDHNNGTIIFDGGTGTITCNSDDVFNLVKFEQGTNAKSVGSSCNLPLGANPTINGRITLNGTLSGSGVVTQNQIMSFINSNVNLIGFNGWIANNTFSLGGIFGPNIDFSNYTVVDFNAFFNFATGTFTAPSGVMTVSAPFLDSDFTGTFNHNNGTVIFDGEGTNQYINASVTLNNVTATKPGQLIMKASKTLTVLGDLTLRGTASSPLILSSSTPGIQWSIDAQGTRNLRYLNVQDSHNTNAETMQAFDSEDEGNNINWEFPISPIEITAPITNFSFAQASLELAAVAAATAQQQQQNIRASFANLPSINGAFSRLSGIMEKLPGGRETIKLIARGIIGFVIFLGVIWIVIWLIMWWRRRDLTGRELHYAG